jgi:hypothetical protein
MPLDTGFGILIAVTIAKILGIKASASFIIWGVLFALSPDVDAVLNIFRPHGMQHTHRHRDILHYPLIFIPLGTLVIFFISPIHSLLFALCSLMHFLHDSIGIGWGVQWLFPFKRDHYSFLYQYDWARNGLPLKLIHTWKHEEVDLLDEKYGDKNWFANIYLKFHPYGIVEYVVFALGIAALILMSQ